MLRMRHSLRSGTNAPDCKSLRRQQETGAETPKIDPFFFRFFLFGDFQWSIPVLAQKKSLRNGFQKPKESLLPELETRLGQTISSASLWRRVYRGKSLREFTS